MRLIILSDIHGNLSALQSVTGDFTRRYEPDGIVLLGDIINYGMRPNEVIGMLRNIGFPIIASICGNHEKALEDGETSHFSTERGKHLLAYTRFILSDDSREFIMKECASEGKIELTMDGKSVLIIHGSLSDPYWGKMDAQEMADPRYSAYDLVLSGHSHIPNLTERFYECDSPDFRNKKRTVFINPGSVGQPRNHNPRAQYAFLDILNEICHFNSVEYDVRHEQSLYPDFLDSFYSQRLTNGI